jgi:hypothetical protein
MKKNIASGIVAIFFIGLLIGAVFAYALTGPQKLTIAAGVYPGSPSFTIWIDAGTTYAKNSYGMISYSSTNASYVLGAAAAASTSPLKVQAGLYNVTATILFIINGTGIIGDGIDKTVFSAQSSIGNKPVMDCRDLDQMVFKDFTLDMRSIKTLETGLFMGYITRETYDGLVQNIRVAGCNGFGLCIGGNPTHRNYRYLVDSNKIEGIAGNDWDIATFVTGNSEIRNNVFSGNDGHFAATVFDADSTAFVYNHFKNIGGGWALALGSTIGCTVSGNTFVGFTGNPRAITVYKETDNPDSLVPQSNIIDGNIIITSMANTAISIDYPSVFTQVINNIIDLQGAIQTAIVTNNASEVRVTGNIIRSANAGVSQIGATATAVVINDNQFYTVTYPVVWSAHPIVYKNIGYVTENSFSGTNTTTGSAVLDHGLVAAPTYVWVSFSTAAITGYHWTVTSTQVTIYPTGSLPASWICYVKAEFVP